MHPRVDVRGYGAPVRVNELLSAALKVLIGHSEQYCAVASSVAPLGHWQGYAPPTFTKLGPQVHCASVWLVAAVEPPNKSVDQLPRGQVLHTVFEVLVHCVMRAPLGARHVVHGRHGEFGAAL